MADKFTPSIRLAPLIKTRMQKTVNINAKKALSLYLLRKPNASRNQIVDELGDYGYNDVWDVMDHFKLKLEGVKKEYVDKKGVEHVAAALPQTEEEPIKECKTC